MSSQNKVMYVLRNRLAAIHVVDITRNTTLHVSRISYYCHVSLHLSQNVGTDGWHRNANLWDGRGVRYKSNAIKVSCDWGCPVVFRRCSDGRLQDEGDADRAKSPTTTDCSCSAVRRSIEWRHLSCPAFMCPGPHTRWRHCCQCSVTSALSETVKKRAGAQIGDLLHSYTVSQSSYTGRLRSTSIRRTRLL